LRRQQIFGANVNLIGNCVRISDTNYKLKFTTVSKTEKTNALALTGIGSGDLGGANGTGADARVAVEA
jgi:hypothetical protein